MSRRYLVAGNWKMHGSQSETADLIGGIAERISMQGETSHTYDVLVCPPAPYLAAAKAVIAARTDARHFHLGGQDVNANQSGAFTGEVSLSMLAEFGCSHVLLGHSERRELFAESDASVAEKFTACIGHESAIVPVLCVGETLADRQSGNTESVVARQLDAVLDQVGIIGFTNAVVAYEPVWAIGTGETATPQQAQQVHAFIRGKLSDLDAEIGEQLQILYGGSVKPGNAAELFAQADIDGGLIGGAALDADSFSGICAAAGQLTS